LGISTLSTAVVCYLQEASSVSNPVINLVKVSFKKWKLRGDEELDGLTEALFGGTTFAHFPRDLYTLPFRWIIVCKAKIYIFFLYSMILANREGILKCGYQTKWKNARKECKPFKDGFNVS